MTDKKKPEMTEGQQALDNFKNALGKVLKVSHAEMKKQLEAEKKEKPKKVTKVSRGE